MKSPDDSRGIKLQTDKTLKSPRDALAGASAC